MLRGFVARGFVAKRICHFGSTCVGATALSGSVALLFVIPPAPACRGSAAEESAVPRTFPGNVFGTRLTHNCHPAIVTATYVICRRERRMVCASATRLHGVRGQTELSLHETTRPRNCRESTSCVCPRNFRRMTGKLDKIGRFVEYERRRKDSSMLDLVATLIEAIGDALISIGQSISGK
jgi:hypothetical protein